MPTLRAPLFGSYNKRSFNSSNTKDQLFKACILSPVFNKQSRTASYYVEKRSGLESLVTVAGGSTGLNIFVSPFSGNVYTAFKSGSTITVYEGSTNCGDIVSSGTGGAVYFGETVLGSTGYLLITVVTSLIGTVTGWYLPSDASAQTSYTCDGNNSTTITDIKISGVNSVAGLYVGQKLTAASNIVAGSRIVSINAGAFSAVLDTATTGGAFNDLATTKEPVAMINDADFPSNAIGGFAELDGYVFIMAFDGKVYQSDLNSVSAWTSGNYLTTTASGDMGVGLFKYKNYIVAFSGTSIEFLYNAGNPSGSVLSTAPQLAIVSKQIAPISATTLCTNGDRLFWLGTDTNLYSLEGFSPKKISSFGTPIWSIGSCSSFFYNKQSYVQIAISGSAINYWYCIDSDCWLEPNFGTSPAHFSNTSISYPYVVLGDTSGKYYRMNDVPDSTIVYLDNGSAVTMSIQLATHMGTNARKFGDELRIDADVQSSGTLSVSYSDDDGATFSAARTIDLTSQQNMRITRLGTWKGVRLWKFEHSANTPFRMKMLEIDYHL